MIFLLGIACAINDQDSSSIEAITWTKDVQPIIEQNCVRCHQLGGQGTGDYTDFSVVENMAPLILSAIDSGNMPPAAADPECHDYQDSEKIHLSNESKNIIAQWVDAGTPYGDPQDAQEYDRSQSELMEANLTLKLQEPYTPTFTDADNPKNEYRCFALEHNQTEPFYIKSMHPIIDNVGMVHHLVLAKANDNALLENSLNPEGVDCIRNGVFISGNFQDGGMMAGWAPGMSPVRLPQEAGLLVRPDDYIIIQMHYYQSESLEKDSDQSGYAFEITPEVPENVVTMAPLGVQGFTIPAGDESYTFGETLNLPIAVKVWGVFPHMHILGSGYELKTDNECLIASDKYDFDNQLTYMYDEPVTVPAGSNIHMSCTWNNSTSNPDLIIDPPQDVGYGERTDEEMCYAFALVSLAN